MTVVMADFEHNPSYGTLQIEQPGKALYTMDDLTRWLITLEKTLMPIHVLVIDYVTYMHRVRNTERFVPPQIPDYNQMIRELKRICLTHRNGTTRGRSAL